MSCLLTSRSGFFEPPALMFWSKPWMTSTPAWGWVELVVLWGDSHPLNASRMPIAVLQVSREGSARPGCVSAAHNQQRLAASWCCQPRQGTEGHGAAPWLPACCFQPLAGLGLGQVRLILQHGQLPPTLRAQINTCEGRAGGAGSTRWLQCTRHLSSGGDRASNARQMALCWGWWPCSLRGAFKETNWW